MEYIHRVRGKMFTTHSLVFLVALVVATHTAQKQDVTEDFSKPVLFGNVHRDGTISNAFVPYAISQRQLDPPEEPPYDMLHKQNKPQDAISSVRDIYEAKRKRGEKTKIPSKKESEARSRMWFDFEELLDKNDARANAGIVKISSATQKPKPPVDLHPERHFAKGSFILAADVKKKRHPLNWTTCEQIGGDPKFHPKDIMDIEWLPFYTWSIRFLPPVYPHVFSIPSVKTVKEYQLKFKNKLNVKVDWRSPKMMLKENQEMLLIAADRAGLFYGITNIELPEWAQKHPIQRPVIKLRLKIFDPYLFLMYCDLRYATLMAINGREPQTDEEKALEAATIPFRGQGQPVTRNFEEERMRNEYRLERKLHLASIFPEASEPIEPGAQIEPKAVLPNQP